MSHKLYVLVRGDLSRSQQAVQAGHAVAEWTTRNEWLWDHWNRTIVYLKVRDLPELEGWHRKLSPAAAPFYEPDINQLTAMAALGIDDMVIDLPLM